MLQSMQQIIFSRNIIFCDATEKFIHIIKQLLDQYNKIFAASTFKENELARSFLILYKANICGIHAITVLLYGKKFLSHYTMILSRDHWQMSRDEIFYLKICRIIMPRFFLHMNVKVNVFSVL